MEQVVAQKLRPEVLHLLRFGEKPVSADVEAEPLGFNRSGNATDVPRIPLENSDVHTLPREQEGRSEAGQTGADNRDMLGQCHGEGSCVCRRLPLRR